MFKLNKLFHSPKKFFIDNMNKTVFTKNLLPYYFLDNDLKHYNEKKKLRIVTFGSCLSRYTADHYIRFFGGKIVSSVYHNRSDAFVGKFIDKDWKIYDHAQIFPLLKNDNVIENTDNQTSRLFRNQYPETMGTHNLSQGTLLFDVLNQKKADMIIIDNYVDLSALLLRFGKTDKEGVFLRPRDLKENYTDFTLSDYLDPEHAVLCMQKIIAFFKEKIPSAMIVFMNFPYNTYDNKHNRITRTQEYEKLFTLENGLVIPCLTIAGALQTHEKRHFKPEQYCAYAGMVHHYVINSLAGNKKITKKIA